MVFINYNHQKSVKLTFNKHFYAFWILTIFNISFLYSKIFVLKAFFSFFNKFSLVKMSSFWFLLFLNLFLFFCLFYYSKLFKHKISNILSHRLYNKTAYALRFCLLKNFLSDATWNPSIYGLSKYTIRIIPPTLGLIGTLFYVLLKKVHFQNLSELELLKRKCCRGDTVGSNVSPLPVYNYPITSFIGPHNNV